MSTSPDLGDYVASYSGLVFLATASIYAGSVASLPNPKTKEDGSNDYDYDDNEPLIQEKIRLEDAYWFPILGSAVLLSLYLIIKYISIWWINTILQLYFSVITIGATWRALVNFARTCIGPSRYRALSRLTLTLHHNQESILQLHYPTFTLVFIPLALYPPAVYLFFPGIMSQQHTLLMNIMALSLTHTALASIKLDSVFTGVILLSGLFLYDIWWVFGSKPVFGSSVMVTVAQGLDAPIKILLPKSKLLQGNQYTMLGLGDIVVPGMFIALALRYDLHRSSHQDFRQPFAKPFFVTTLVSYILAMILTIVVMHTFEAAQPALLYLRQVPNELWFLSHTHRERSSPACISAFLAVGWYQGVWNDMWTYSEISDSQEQEKKEKKD
ncbi:hypothetical protein FRC17_005651 [Serendipita sp. 399]|nr:hypothetical protein FRC17_005651 [Serendipita sp. 399]